MVLDQYWARYREDIESGGKTRDEGIELAFRHYCDYGYDSVGPAVEDMIVFHHSSPVLSF
jgi:hypothetical protein